MSTQVAELNVTDMLSVTKRLTAIIKEELEMMKEMKITELHKFQDEKLKLTSVMESYKSILSNNPGIVRSIPKNIMDELRKVSDEFEAIVAAEGHQIIKVKKVHALIMDAIKKVLEDREKKNANYNQYGQLDAGKKKMIFIQPVSISESF
jgi:hypothetical protein